MGQKRLPCGFVDVVTCQSGDDFKAPDESHAQEKFEIHQKPGIKTRVNQFQI